MKNICCHYYFIILCSKVNQVKDKKVTNQNLSEKITVEITYNKILKKDFDMLI